MDSFTNERIGINLRLVDGAVSFLALSMKHWSSKAEVGRGTREPTHCVSLIDKVIGIM